MATPSWLAAVSGMQANAGTVNQLLAAHPSTWVYPGVLQSQQSTAGSGSSSLQSGYLAQLIATTSTQTSIGRVALQIATVGGSGTTTTIPPLTVSLYASDSSVPTGSALVTVQVPEQYVFNSSPWVSIPLGATGLTAAAPYCIVATGPGTAGAHYTWNLSNQVSGAASSTDGVNWTAQAYGLIYEVFDATNVWPPVAVIEDGGARLTALTWNAAIQLTGIGEYVQAQDGTTLTTTRTLSYASGGTLTGVT